MSEFPECDKLLAVRDKSQSVGEFIEWLSTEKQIFLAEWRPLKEFKPGEREHRVAHGREVDRLVGIAQPIERLLAEFFEIDMEQVETERRQMLADIQQPRLKRGAK